MSGSMPARALRRSLDAMPSPVEDRPGLLLRDPFGYTEDVVIIRRRSCAASVLRREHEEGDLAEALTGPRASSRSSFARQLAETLGGGGFLENED